MFTSFRLSVRPQSDFVCDCDPEYRSACVGEEFCGVNQGKRYCVFHLPSADKSEPFNYALARKRQRGGALDFQGVWFPDDIDFSRVDFTESDFTGATFNGKATFSHASFAEGAYFSDTTFNGDTDFGAARFEKGVNFASSVFKGRTDFNFAHFMREVDFTAARFDAAVIFQDAHFGDHARFAGGTDCTGTTHSVFTDADSALDLQFARIEKADRISFHSLKLRPSWFVNVDTRSFRFARVKWLRRTVEEEIASVEKKTPSPHLTLSTAYRNLALNAEENHRYEEASRFRFRAMEATRLDPDRGWDPLTLIYRVASGYGEHVLLAAGVLVGLLVICAVLYTQVGFARWEPRLSSESEAMVSKKDDDGAPLPLQRALTYSAGVMTLQKPEPRPATITAQTIVLLETIVGPVQAALLALAIRRKFMR